MKRLFLLCLCCFLLTACSRTSSGATASPQPQIPSASATEAPTETPVVQETPTEAPVEEVVVEAAPVEEGTPVAEENDFAE